MVTKEAVRVYSEGVARDHKGRVFLALLFHGISERAVWPSTTRVGELTGLDRRQVSAALQRLRADGVIEEEGCVKNGVKRWRLSESRVPTKLGNRVPTKHGNHLPTKVGTNRQENKPKEQEEEMPPKLPYPQWPDIPADVHLETIRWFRRLILLSGCRGMATKKSVGVREGLGARAQAFADAGLLPVFRSRELWDWIEAELLPDGVYVGKDPSWAWKNILGKLDQALLMKKKEVAAKDARARLEQDLDQRSVEIRRKQELEARASDGDVEAMRELYGDAVVDAYLKSHSEKSADG